MGSMTSSLILVFSNLPFEVEFVNAFNRVVFSGPDGYVSDTQGFRHIGSQ